MTDTAQTVLNAAQFGDINHRINNTDLVGLLVAQHMLKKLADVCRSRIVEGDKPKPENQSELDLKAKTPAKKKARALPTVKGKRS